MLGAQPCLELMRENDGLDSLDGHGDFGGKTSLQTECYPQTNDTLVKYYINREGPQKFKNPEEPFSKKVGNSSLFFKMC